ncbi:hypothetical protein [Devosia sp. RR2S18]|nr:hypothetical protein [Devosia sp. RR2S18]WIJ23975.1 hypothetical protein QOV41_13125 [Devosia sp. RR2S18]
MPAEALSFNAQPDGGTALYAAYQKRAPCNQLDPRLLAARPLAPAGVAVL